MGTKNKTIKILVSIFAVTTVTFIAVFYVYVSDYYRVDSSAIVSVTNSKYITRDGSITSLETSPPSTICFIFYPGGKVESDAYLPLLNLVRNKGVKPFLVNMPFNLAVLNSNAATKVIDSNPQITTWYIGGHSLGGAMASHYFSSHTDIIDGLILLGSYTYGDVPLDRTLIIYGSEDMILDTSQITQSENVTIIEGGNHAQFGNYGPQSGDGVPTITPIEQQVMTTDIIIEFISEDTHPN